MAMKASYAHKQSMETDGACSRQTGGEAATAQEGKRDEQHLRPVKTNETTQRTRLTVKVASTRCLCDMALGQR
jgi:hypothetical protein